MEYRNACTWDGSTLYQSPVNNLYEVNVIIQKVKAQVATRLSGRPARSVALMETYSYIACPPRIRHYNYCILYCDVCIFCLQETMSPLVTSYCDTTVAAEATWFVGLKNIVSDPSTKLRGI